MQKFLRSDDTNDAANAISTGLAINEQIRKLNDGVELLAKQLQTQVREQHKSLLLEAQNATKLSAAVDLVSHHMNQLEMGAERLKSKINTPYGLLSNQTRALARLHDVSHILRQSNRFLQLFQKLTTASKDIAAQAIILFEIELLIDNEQLNQIDFIRDERIVAANLKQRLTNSAHHDLLNALKSLDDEEKAVQSLQVNKFQGCLFVLSFVILNSFVQISCRYSPICNAYQNILTIYWTYSFRMLNTQLRSVLLASK